jgi:hypothetical protein
MVTGPEEELAGFLEFGDLPLTFPFDEASQHGRCLQQEADGAMDTPMGNGTGMLPLEDGQLQHQISRRNPIGPVGGYPPPFHQMNLGGELYNRNPHPHPQLQVPPYRPQSMIPPTPTSIEMHGDPPRYYQAAGEHHPHALYDRLGTHMKDAVRLMDAGGVRGFGGYGLIRYADHVYPAGLPRGHPARCAIPISRVCGARRVL